MKTSKVFVLNNIFILFIAAITLLNSCIPQKKLKYLQSKIENDTVSNFALKQRPKNTVQPFDNLYIRILSPDATTSNMLNGPPISNNIDYSMTSYLVNDSGYILFPYVGLIKVKDLTILAAQDTIQSALSQYINEVSVTLKFVGKNVTVLGEVLRQGEYIITSDNISIFKAISRAGGLTDYGDRETVTIIREENGKAQLHQVDLTDKYIMQSNYYYLKPEDVVVVQPLKQKSFGFAQFPYALVLSSITTLITIWAILRN
jgi:polysaccharide export outer membrane protein